MTILDTTIAPFDSMSFKACKEKFFALLRQKAEEAMKTIEAIQDKVLSFKAAEASKIGLAGIFAGVFCVFFALIYTMVCYANRRE